MTTTPAGWYPDPEDATRSRWWDGAQWTEHRSAPAIATPYAAAPYSASATADLRAPEGTEWNTAWIWLIALLPLIPIIGLFSFDWGGLIDLSDPTGMSSLAFLVSPGYLIGSLGGWVVYGLCVWFAYLDWRELGRRGVPRPFHWAWTFLSSAVYVIGRSVVVRKRTGRGISPMWATIAILVISFGATIYIVAVVMAAVFDAVSTIAR
jgi:hypothetical protein